MAKTANPAPRVDAFVDHSFTLKISLALANPILVGVIHILTTQWKQFEFHQIKYIPATANNKCVKWHQIVANIYGGNALARSALLKNNTSYPKRGSSNPGHYLTCLLYAYSLLAACRGVSWQLSCVNGAEEKQWQLKERLFSNDVFLAPILIELPSSLTNILWQEAFQASRATIFEDGCSAGIIVLIVAYDVFRGAGGSNQEHVLDGKVIHFINILWETVPFNKTKSKLYSANKKNINYKIINTNNICLLLLTADASSSFPYCNLFDSVSTLLRIKVSLAPLQIYGV